MPTTNASRAALAVLFATAAMLSACGGGGSEQDDVAPPPSAPVPEPSPPPAPPVSSLAGAYATGSRDNPGGEVFITPDGSAVGQFSDGNAHFAFSGRIEIGGTGAGGAPWWTIRDALIYSRTLSGTVVDSTTRANLSGTAIFDVEGRPHVYVEVPESARAAGMNPVAFATYKADRASLAWLAGRYVQMTARGSPEPWKTDFTIEAGGRISGRLRPQCDIEGTLAVGAAGAMPANLYYGTVSLAGDNCPGGAGSNRLVFADPFFPVWTTKRAVWLVLVELNGALGGVIAHDAAQ